MTPTLTFTVPLDHPSLDYVLAALRGKTAEGPRYALPAVDEPEPALKKEKPAKKQKEAAEDDGDFDLGGEDEEAPEAEETHTLKTLKALVDKCIERAGIPATREVFKTFKAKKLQDLPEKVWPKFAAALRAANKPEES